MGVVTRLVRAAARTGAPPRRRIDRTFVAGLAAVLGVSIALWSSAIWSAYCMIWGCR
jgi:hypothetical protein